jgi:hypothetical protein
MDKKPNFIVSTRKIFFKETAWTHMSLFSTMLFIDLVWQGFHPYEFLANTGIVKRLRGPLSEPNHSRSKKFKVKSFYLFGTDLKKLGLLWEMEL